jgi:uncharacterized repeat protein (TIGR01451 family)
LLRIYKSNSAKGPVKNGDAVSFKIVVDNDGLNDLYNIVVYDSLRGPNNNVVATKKYPLGKIASMEEISINYDVGIVSLADEGIYTNSAYAEGLNSQLLQVKTQAAALSSFTLQNSGNSPGAAAEDANNQATSSTVSLTATSTPVLGIGDDGNSKQSSNPVPLIGTVKGASTQRLPQNPAAAGNPDGMFTPSAQASPDVETYTPQFSAAVTEPEPGNNTWSGSFLGIFLLCFLIAFGYATANLIKRTRQENILVHPAEAAIIPEIPVFAVKKVTAKKPAGRPRKRLNTNTLENP